jgi:hypothetical protein
MSVKANDRRSTFECLGERTEIRCRTGELAGSRRDAEVEAPPHGGGRAPELHLQVEGAV